MKLTPVKYRGLKLFATLAVMLLACLDPMLLAQIAVTVSFFAFARYAFEK